FDRHACALREILQHRMRRITYERDSAIAPVRHWIPIAQYPAAPVARFFEHAPGKRRQMLEMCQQLVAVAGLVVAFGRALAMECRHDVEELPITQRVMDHVALRSCP